jgi:hypothetical protein
MHRRQLIFETLKAKCESFPQSQILLANDEFILLSLNKVWCIFEKCEEKEMFFLKYI